LLTLLLPFVAGFLATFALVPLCRRLAQNAGYVAKPKADRWNARPTALLGGVAIAMVVLIGGAGLDASAQLRIILVAGVAMFLLGLVDDLANLKPSTKLVAEITIASLLVFFGYRLHWVESLTLDAMLTVLWVVGVTNAFNLLDNMDGLAAGIGFIAAAALLVGFADMGEVGPRAAYTALLMGSLAGFLLYNFHPASIFMGDSGSLFIGLSVATLALENAPDSRAGSSLLSIVGGPVLVLLIPIFDTTLVTVLRLLSGRRPSQGGRDHSSHRLVAIGLSERMAVTVLWTLAALGGLIALVLRTLDTGLGAAAAGGFLLALAIFAIYLSRVRVYEDSDVALLKSGRITPFVTDLMYKRRAAEVLLDLCLVALSYYTAYRLRFEGKEYGLYFRQFLNSLPIVIGLQLPALFVAGVYRGVWRYFGLMDGVVLAKGVLGGMLAIVGAIVFVFRFEDYSRGVFVIYAAILMLALSGSRASFRLISEFVRRRRVGDRLVIYGAGDGGSVVLHELLSGAHAHYRVLGFIDDNPVKQRHRVQGYPVLGGYETLAVLATERAVDCVVVSARELDGGRLRSLEELCSENGITLSRLHLKFEQLVAS
jgi:UDP-GlcNAc:undecaprenyl-phosphate/decaprenyl-phosphate GlcNAc-1-phosphate transferase